MRSKTSFFNKTLFFKSMARFWPVWGSYFAIWLIILPVMLLANSYSLANDPIDASYTLYTYATLGGVIMGAIYGVFSAMGAWSFLYNSRSTHGFACLPVTREGQFISTALSGIAPIYASNVVIFLLALLIETGYGALHLPSLLTWLAVVSLIYLFFFGFATLCALTTGGLVILPLVYGVLNFVAVGVEALLRAVFSQFVYGMENAFYSWGGLTTRYFSPVVGYFTTLGYDAQYIELADGRHELTGYVFYGWGTVLAYAVVGLVMLAAALFLLKKRRMETAGDVVAVRPLKPVFRWCMALGVGLCFACLMYAIIFNYRNGSRDTAFLAMLIFLLIGAAIGWIIAEMLIKKSFRVFRKNTHWAGLGACGLVIVAAMLGMRFDLFGYERRVPDADSVESVYIYGNGETAIFTTPEGIAAAEAFHRQVIDNKAWNEQYHNSYYWARLDYVVLRVNYTLSGGGSLARRYALVYENDYATGEPTKLHDVTALNELMNSREAIENRKKLNSVTPSRETVYHASASAAMTAVECAAVAGYASPEEYVLREQYGRTAGEIAAMDALERDTMLGQAVLDFGVNGYALYHAASDAALGPNKYPASASDMPVEVPLTEVAGEYADYGYRYRDSYDMADFARDLDWNKVYFRYALTLTDAEAWELYESCILPDIADGALGRVWVLTDETYRNTVYDASINIEFREKPEESSGPVAVNRDGYRYESFYTHPTVDSARTNAWLTAHGLSLYTEADLDF